MNFNFNPDNELSKKGPKIYFRGVNRIHINRFKAYIHILSNRIIHDWQITDTVSEAQAVITYEDNGSDQSVMHLKLYADTANQANGLITSYELSFDENRLIKQLNKAGHQLALVKTDKILNKKKIQVFGHNTESTQMLVASLNNTTDSEVNKFKVCKNILNEKTALFFDHLVLVLDPASTDSVQLFYQLEEQRKQNNITFNDYTVVILHDGASDLYEQIFDEIYEQADSNTQITLLNPSSKTEIKDFIKYF